MSSTPMIVRGTNDKPAASGSLVEQFESSGLDGQLFVGYPIIGAPDGKHAIDAVFVSPSKGIIVFDLVEGSDLADYEDRQDDTATKLTSRLMAHRELVQRRKLVPLVTPVTYAPAINASRLRTNDAEYLVASSENLQSVVESIEWPDADPEIYARTLSALQNVSSIRRARSARSVTNPDSRGAKLQALEGSIATLDRSQGKAVIETVDGVQRIRGLAGSGKTIVLALKAAYLHAQHPEWRIAVTFQTRSLRAQFERLINNFSIEQTGTEPDWDNLRIIHAWGAPGGGRREGIYHQFCIDNGLIYRDFVAAKQEFGYEHAFQGACTAALAEADHIDVAYDAILIDEAQDFPPEFLRLCYAILSDKKRLVYAYDELQNLSSASMPSAEEIFGADSTGRPLVSLQETPFDQGARRDVILERCYRNSRPVLATAHALGFGIYRTSPDAGKPGLVQMFDQPTLWTDIGYEVRSGELEAGEAVALTRTAETSPLFLEQHSPTDDLVTFMVFNTRQEQADWIAAEIESNLKNDQLRHDDIVVINPDPLSARKMVGPIRSALYDRGVQNHLAGVDTGADVFFKPDSDSITFTGIYRAKGNEAGMVYVVNADECYESVRNLARRRNMLFTAITRSKAWVRVVGVGPDMASLKAEYESVRDASFELRFVYPTEKERNLLQIVHRDKSREEERAVRKSRDSIADILSDLEAGRVFLEDLDDSVVARLKRILSQDG